MLQLAAMVFGLAILMIVHEAGHYFVARAFGMRVERFSIGFGPPLFKRRSRDGETVFQVALIPVLAYVQIAGMNPFEEIDPDDRASYANASLTARISAIFAGPLANYLFASVLFFVALLLGGKLSDEPYVTVLQDQDTAAARAGMETGDRVVSIDGAAIERWTDIPKHVTGAAGKRLSIVVRRDGRLEELAVVPDDRGGKGFLGVGPTKVAIPAGEAAVEAVVQPALIVAQTTVSLARMLAGQEQGELTGPIGIMRETRKAAELGLPFYLAFLGFLSTSVGFFNMLPFPALDGGRLVFLGYEAITRRRPNQKIEAQIHMVGMLMLLTAILLVSFREFGTDKSPSELAAERERQRQKSAEPKAEPARAP
jgi:regulator of sigma E protease